MLIIRKYLMESFGENTYLVFESDSREAVIIDPGAPPNEMISDLEKDDLEVKYILLTHAHIDHVLGVEAVKECTNAKLFLGESDLPYLAALPEQSRFVGVEAPFDSIAHDGVIKDGDIFTIGGIEIKAIETPGHSAGGVTFLIENNVFVGDTLFSGSVGRVDLPGGSWDILSKSIHEKLLTLDRDTVVYCGHGPDTTIGKEVDTNPFLKEGVRI